jgi:hypothetical protein
VIMFVPAPSHLRRAGQIVITRGTGTVTGFSQSLVKNG